LVLGIHAHPDLQVLDTSVLNNYDELNNAKTQILQQPLSLVSLPIQSDKMKLMIEQTKV
jgi:hypothetical protein